MCACVWCMCGVCVCACSNHNGVFSLNYTDEIESAQIKVQVLRVRDPGYMNTRSWRVKFVCVCFVRDSLGYAVYSSRKHCHAPAPFNRDISHDILDLYCQSDWFVCVLHRVSSECTKKPEDQCGTAVSEHTHMRTHICTHTLHYDSH